MVFSLGKSLPTVPFHLHLVVHDEFLGAFLVRPDGGADELVAPKEEIIALSVGIASSPDTHILHQSKVADWWRMVVEEHGRGGKGGAWEGREERSMAE